MAVTLTVALPPLATLTEPGVEKLTPGTSVEASKRTWYVCAAPLVLSTTSSREKVSLPFLISVTPKVEEIRAGLALS